MNLIDLIARLQAELDESKRRGVSPHRVLVSAEPGKGWATKLEIDFAADACGGGSDFIILRWAH